MFNKNKIVRTEELIEILTIRDDIIKTKIEEIERKADYEKRELLKKIESLTSKTESLKEKINHYCQDEIEEKYCYKVEIDGKTSLWENPELFKEWFKKEIFKKKEFRANENAWAIITEIIKEDTDVKTDSEINS